MLYSTSAVCRTPGPTAIIPVTCLTVVADFSFEHAVCLTRVSGQQLSNLLFLIKAPNLVRNPHKIVGVPFCGLKGIRKKSKKI